LPDTPLTREQAEAARLIVIEECRATAIAREWGAEGFIRAFMDEKHPCREFRFQGALGFGGKLYYDPHAKPPLRVGYYRENETPEREAMVAKANRRLAAIEF
jgi:hypothetical protein